MIRRRTASLGATLGLGFATLISLGVATLSGILLMFFYVPSVEQAHNSVQDLISVVPLGAFMRNLHRWSAHASVLFCLLHMLRTLLWGSFRGAHGRVWLLGVGLLLLTLATSFSGYLLPWDQDAYWTVTVGTSLVGYVPLVGDALKQILLGGPDVGQPALTRFYVLHVVALPAVGLVFLLLHLFRLRRAGGLARSGESRSAVEELVPASPVLTRRQLLLTVALLAVFILLAAFVDARLGPAPDLMRPDNPPKAPWFLVGLQEMVSYAALLGGFVFPAVLLLLVALGPWLDGRKDCDGRFLPGRLHRVVMIGTVSMVAAVGILSLRWWGDPQHGKASWINPATLASLAVVLIALTSGLARRDRSLTLQALLGGLVTLLVMLSCVGWFWRGPDWKLTFHPGPGHPEATALATRMSKLQIDEVLQTTTPDGKIDRCMTCHPTEKHPAIAGHVDISRFGCTPCHGGQGRRLDMQAHGPSLGGGPDPFLPKSLRQARCARCHVPTGLVGAPSLDGGFREYMDAACSGCHLPGRKRQGLGPDLRRLGRRTRKELLEAILEPRKGHEQAVMWSLKWRYDATGDQGSRTLDDLLTTMLVLSDSPTPYRSAWARPALSIDADCEGCHQEIDGGRLGGRPHRCTFLKSSEHLRCRSCHGDQTNRPRRTGGKCPQIRQSSSLCPVCHLRPGDGAASN